MEGRVAGGGEAKRGEERRGEERRGEERRGEDKCEKYITKDKKRKRMKVCVWVCVQ